MDVKQRMHTAERLKMERRCPGWHDQSVYRDCPSCRGRPRRTSKLSLARDNARRPIELVARREHISFCCEFSVDALLCLSKRLFLVVRHSAQGNPQKERQVGTASGRRWR